MLSKPIGIFGGTFDPIHYGHLRAALELYQILDLQEVRFIPCQTPVHKQSTLTSASHRLAMLQLAIEGVAGLTLDSREVNRNTPSYMIDTLQSLRQDFPKEPLCLILGTDSFLSLSGWKQWQNFLDIAHIVVALRPGYRLSPCSELERMIHHHQATDKADLQENKHGLIYVQLITQLDITATAIRQQISAGYNPSFLLPEKVWHYIQQHKLY